MRLVYSLAILIYTGLIKIAAVFNPKARLWVNGRKGWRKSLRDKFSGDEKTIWVHCASLGEFEQGRPVIELIREKYPQKRILLTFFSPSGYEIRKEWPFADHICYLPADTPGNAKDFINIVRPEKALFIKYEFWGNYINALHNNGIPVFLLSAIFRPGQVFFRWYGGFFRSLLRKYSHIFVQDGNSADLLIKAGIGEVTVSGDTRFDRVIQIAGSSKKIDIIESFAGGSKLFIAGSSWKHDEEIMAKYINDHPGRLKWVFAPHEIDNRNIERLEGLFTVKHARYSEKRADYSDIQVLIIDNIGLLSSAYRYAYIAGVGGGFGKGIHNILEPACWRLPVLFGPNHLKFREAVELIRLGGAFTYGNYEEFERQLDMLLCDEKFYREAADISGNFISENSGATHKIATRIFS